MSMDSKGNYWLCDKDNGVFKITPNGNGSYHIINIRHDDNDPNSLSHDAAYQAVEDHQGNIWIATYGGGVNILKQDKAGNYTAMHAKNSLKRYPVKTYQKVRTIAVAKDGSVWAGTTDGILIMSINKNGNVSVERLKEPESLEDGLQSSDVVYLTTDKEGNMWVGTNSGGLSCAKKQDENGAWLFENFGVKNGLPTEEIRSITFDNDGNGWIGTDHILCSFNVKKKIFTAFSNLDGVDDTMLSEGAAISANNGNILFGTLNGYYVVDRSKLTAKKGSLLRLHITDFFLNDELQSPRLTNTYDYYVPESRIVTIPNHSDAFSFRFAALNYQLQHRVHYQYKLNGYDNDWRNAGKDRTATYEDIPAGTYQFQVKAFLLESPDNFDIRTIEVVVPPLFIFSPAAIWIYIFLLSVCGIGGLWWYQERLRKQSKAQKKTEKEASGRLQTDEEKQVKEEPKPIKETQPETDVYEIIE